MVLDVENDSIRRDGKLHLDPFEPDNRLVNVGVLIEGKQLDLYTFDHEEVSPTEGGGECLQMQLDETTLLVCHNVSHDLLWLWESGFHYQGKVFDTMLGEYILLRGNKSLSLALGNVAERLDLKYRKKDIMKDYFKKGYRTSEIPHDELLEYLEADLRVTEELYQSIVSRLNEEENKILWNTVDLTNDVAFLLTDMYRTGFKVDTDALEQVRVQFEQERDELHKSLQEHVYKLMGDTPINLNSPEQLSWVIYGRRVINKQRWANDINPLMSRQDLKVLINRSTEVLYKTKAVQCDICQGSGKMYKTKKDGTRFARPNKCTNCDAKGYIFQFTSDRAGLRFVPPTAKWLSANGFSTSKGNLQALEQSARNKGKNEAVDFLSKVRRLSAVETYLSSFVEGIRIHTKPDGKLHVKLNQHTTSTGRFSGDSPNMQNMPRGGTFPVKKVFVSRWEGGEIMEADFAQLEFRAAAFLSQDEVAIDEVTNGFDVHSYTAKVITDAGQPTSRQDAKAHTFAPLYGATGYGRTTAEAAYYEHFTQKYKGIKLWHTKLAKEALNTGMITTPSGRQFSFPDVQRKRHGGVTHFTQIKNYPVQSFATADIVPVALLHIYNSLKNLMSCVVNTVHDSIVIDVHPDERCQVIDILRDTNEKLPQLIKDRWNVDFNVPLLLEAKIGPNWLDTKDVA